jgi:hypothetical protein
MPYNDKNNGRRDEVEFQLVKEFEPVNKGENNRVYFEISKAVNHTKGESYVFVRMVDQYRSKEGAWKYTGKNPSLRPGMLPQIAESLKAVMAFLDGKDTAHGDGGLGDKLKGGNKTAPKSDSDDEEPF